MERRIRGELGVSGDFPSVEILPLLKGPFKYDVSMILGFWTPYPLSSACVSIASRIPPERQHQHGIALVEYRVTKLYMLFVSLCAPYLLFSSPFVFPSFLFCFLLLPASLVPSPAGRAPQPPR